MLNLKKAKIGQQLRSASYFEPHFHFLDFIRPNALKFESEVH